VRLEDGLRRTIDYFEAQMSAKKSQSIVAGAFS
jgi:hypothetical protein